MRTGLVAMALCAGLAGCSAAGDPSGEARWSHPGVPFSFAYPADFSKASIDEANTRGDVVGAVGLTKVDVIAVRRQPGGAQGPVRHTVLGRSVTSELLAVPGHSGWVFECQYTSEHAKKLRDACNRALATVR
jgi:hypothetical protein